MHNHFFLHEWYNPYFRHRMYQMQIIHRTNLAIYMLCLLIYALYYHISYATQLLTAEEVENFSDVTR